MEEHATEAGEGLKIKGRTLEIKSWRGGRCMLQQLVCMLPEVVLKIKGRTLDRGGEQLRTPLETLHLVCNLIE